MRDIKIVQGEEYTIERISPCEGCHFRDAFEDGECAMPAEIELDCGHGTVYKKVISMPIKINNK